MDDLDTWPLGEIMFQDREGMGTVMDSPAWTFTMEASPEPSFATGLSALGQDSSDPSVSIFGRSLLSSKADRAAASKSLEELMLHEKANSSAVAVSSSEDGSLSSSYLRKRSAPLDACSNSSHSKKSSSLVRVPKFDEFQVALSSSKSLGSLNSSSSSGESSYAILSSVSPPLPRNLSLLSDEQRSTLQSIVAARRQFLSKSRKSKLEKLYGENLNSEEEMLSHVIRTYISRIPRDHSRLQLDQSTQALRHFIEMQLCIPFENFLITDAKLPGHPIVHATSGFQRLTGYTRQETLGRNCNFIQGASTLTDTIQQFSFLLASAQCGLFEILNYRKDGTPFWNLVYVEPICDQFGLVDKFFGVQVDISDVLDRHHDRSKSKYFNEKGFEIGPMKHADAKASADVALLEDGSVQSNARTMRPFLGDRQVIELVQKAVHSGTPSMIETRFPNRSGPSMLFVRSSPTVKNFMDTLQTDALTSVESAAPLPKDQRDMKVVQFLCRRLSLQFKKRVRYDSRQRVASSRLRVKGRFVPLSEMASSGVVDVGGSGEQNQ